MAKGNNYEIELLGAKEFQRALERSPKKVLEEIKKFTQRGIAEYKRGIMNNPWKVGMSGGGSPVDTGNLRDTHLTDFSTFTGRIYPTASKYMYAVHKGRPWLDFVFNDKALDIEKLEDKMLEEIVMDLVK